MAGLVCIGTLGTTASAVGYLCLARDGEHVPDVWSLLHEMQAAGPEPFPTCQEIIDHAADGRLAPGCNSLGLYGAKQVRLAPDPGTVLLRAARRPDLGPNTLGFS